MTEIEKALNELRAWRKRDNGDSFSRNANKDAEQVLHEVYGVVVGELQRAHDRESVDVERLRIAIQRDAYSRPLRNMEATCHMWKEMLFECLDHLKENGYLSQGWQPIETAPRDGTVVLLHVDGFGVRMGSYGVPHTQSDGFIANGGQACWRAYDKTRCQPFRGLHWQPLPQPPESVVSDE